LTHGGGCQGEDLGICRCPLEDKRDGDIVRSATSEPERGWLT
jgi:hypothetical protein